MTLLSHIQFSTNSYDFLSLLLLFPTILSNGFEPTNPLWGFPIKQDLLHFFTMSTLLSFTIFRYMFEGVYSVFTHREFLTISVFYIVRWLYFFYTLHSSHPASRISRVAKAVAKAETIRVGTSTYPGRRGEKETVVRKGTNTSNGQKQYWRGKIESENRVGDVWKVVLEDEHMHEDTLSAMMKPMYVSGVQNSLDDVYERIYQTIMTVEGSGEPHVDWSFFLDKYSAITKTRFAVRACATADSELAGVARRIAADACNYVSGRGDFRTEEQIRLLNLCVEKAAEDVVRDPADRF